MALIEAVPNFSEGRNTSTIKAIAHAIQSVSGVKLLHIDVGYDANRTVYTLAGSPAKVCEALFNAIGIAAERIDMRYKKGAHPRIGACDVCPLIPLDNVTVEDLLPLVEELAEKTGTSFKVPVFLYEASAKYPYRKNLADIRKREYEGLEDKMKSEAWKSDNHQPYNPRTGATVMGVRPLLIAYNVNLESKDVLLAKEIASQMRYSSGSSYKGLKAIGWMMDKYDCAQVSFNITDTKEVSIAQVFEKVKELAGIRGVNVISSELIGLISEKSIKFALDFYQLSYEKEGLHKLTQKLGLDFISGFSLEKRIIEKLM